MLNAEGAKFAEKFTLSVTYGDDLIARLNLESLNKLKTQVLCTLRECKTPKVSTHIMHIYRAIESKITPMSPYWIPVPTVAQPLVHFWEKSTTCGHGT